MAPHAAPPLPAPPSVAGVQERGARACRPIRGPIELPLRGAPTLDARTNAIDVVQNDGGHPHVTSWETPSLPAWRSAAPTPPREPLRVPVAGRASTPCAVAGDRIFCPDGEGGVHATTRAGAGDRLVASSRAGSRIAAAMLGGTRPALAYLSSRKSTEGWVTEAWLAVADDVPVRMSEDGSGATSVALSPYGDGLLAVMADARAALTAVHARRVTYAGAPKLGEDEVVFVGGPGDRRTRLALVAPRAGAAAWSLLPVARDVSAFGLAVVRIDDPPRVDEPVVWSMYPNGLDPAPVAAAAGSGRSFVARILPIGADPGSAFALELGEVTSSGAFVALDKVAAPGRPSDVALAIDEQGAFWLGWADAEAAWIERFACR